MSKSKSVYVCQNCGAQSPKWLGRCTSCNEWNTYVEEVITREASSSGKVIIRSANSPVRISDVSVEIKSRLKTGMTELDRILGGGIVPGL